MNNLSFIFDYQLLNDVMRVLKQFESVHWEQDFKESCIMRLMIRKSQIDQLTNALTAIYGVEIKTPE